ncbi:MAG TPA: hypothetical protein VNO32_14695, partial [Candidatus Acidoferrum sp.]|nr:hypothetical protein [Candidatus Acidoferrum sp.]
IEKNNALADRPKRSRSRLHRILRKRIRGSRQIQHFSDLSRTSSPDCPVLDSNPPSMAPNISYRHRFGGVGWLVPPVAWKTLRWAARDWTAILISG